MPRRSRTIPAWLQRKIEAEVAAMPVPDEPASRGPSGKNITWKQYGIRAKQWMESFDKLPKASRDWEIKEDSI